LVHDCETTAGRREMTDQPVKALLVEDNAGDARLIREVLAEARIGHWELAHVERLGEALARLAEGGIDVVLLDLSLPDAQGLDTVTRMHAAAPDVPIVVLTGLADEALAARAMREGAQDYLVKGQVDGKLLVRAMRYAIERHRLLVELEQTRQREQQERELRSLERLSGPLRTAVTAQTYGLASLHQSQPDIFGDLVHQYADLLDLALEQRAFRVDHNIPENLRGVAERLGFLKAGPRDVVEIHSAALKEKSGGVTPQKGLAYVEEGRLIVLELMGYLVSYYFNQSRGVGPATSRDNRMSEDMEKIYG